MLVGLYQVLSHKVLRVVDVGISQLSLPDVSDARQVCQNCVRQRSCHKSAVHCCRRRRHSLGPRWFLSDEVVGSPVIAHVIASAESDNSKDANKN